TAPTMSLGGGTFDTGGTSQTLGALTMTASSIIDLASGASILAFANTSASSWTGSLSIYNWSGTPFTGGGTDQLYFGNTSSGLTGAQLNQISFYSDAGNSLFGGGAAILSSGEVVPIPEPSTWLAAALAVGVIGHSQRRRFDVAKG